MNLAGNEKTEFLISVGVGSILQGFTNQDSNFDKAIHANEMAKKKNARVTYYDDLDIYKVLMAVKDKRHFTNFTMMFSGN